MNTLDTFDRACTTETGYRQVEAPQGLSAALRDLGWANSRPVAGETEYVIVQNDTWQELERGSHDACWSWFSRTHRPYSPEWATTEGGYHIIPASVWDEGRKPGPDVTPSLRVVR